MRTFLFFALFIIFSQHLTAQQIILGKVVNRDSGIHLPYASVQGSKDIQTLTNIKGTFQLETGKDEDQLLISYVGFKPQVIQLSSEKQYYLVQLVPKEENLEEVLIYSEENPANHIIKRAIQNKSLNDPELALNSFQYKSYNKFIIDNQSGDLTATVDSTNQEIKAILNQGRAFLSEIIAIHLFKKPNSNKHIVEGISTAGFKKPVYDLLSMRAQPISFYKNDYPVFETDYSAPLANNALKNYSYKILDTLTNAKRPAYMVYFKPRREKAVSGLEGILYLDTVSFAIQKATAQLMGEVELEIEHNYAYYGNENIWFPSTQSITIKPGTGKKDISVFGGSISVGTVQRKKSFLNTVLAPGEIQENLYLSSTTTNFDIELNRPVQIERSAPAIVVTEEANQKSVNYWAVNRQEAFTFEDELTAVWVDRIIKTQNIERKIEVKKAVFRGYYPIGSWDLDLGKLIKYSNYEGFRLGLGGQTNTEFSRNFRLNGYLVYGTKDREFKYGIGGGTLINASTETWLNVHYSDDIKEVGSFKYIRGIEDFSLFEPRFVNISNYYRNKNLQSGVLHRITPRLETEWLLSRSDISQLGNYAFLNNNVIYRDYVITEAKLGFLWRPFSRFLSTPESHVVIDKGYPQFTGQISKGFSNFLGGDFDFTKFGLKADYRIKRLDQSNTEFTLEGNYGIGDLPLTHSFHSYPNSANEGRILKRYSIAGKYSFETMYFDEFFSDRQLALHVRHQFRPIAISNSIKPEFVLISRHVIGDFKNREAHQNIEFKSLKHGYSEAGLELNNMFLGFGLGVAYRYGAYHLPTFSENFSFKFTFQLKI